MKVLAFGEVLFDVFENEERVGGAPFNFAAHIAQQGAEVELLTAIGSDERGKRIREYMMLYSVDDSLMFESTLPTGVCMVKLDQDGVPSYDLVKPAAWDYIPWTEDLQRHIASTTYDLLYLGSLSQRTYVSARTLRLLLQMVNSRWTLFDCNIRPPYVSREAVEVGLTCCTHLKVSREEAPVFSDLGLTNVYTEANRETWCREVAKKFGICQVLLTRDIDGAAIYDAERDVFVEQTAECVKVVSTVGAGDSFGACYIASQLNGDAIQDSLKKAIWLSAQVVQSADTFPSQQVVDKLERCK